MSALLIQQKHDKNQLINHYFDNKNKLQFEPKAEYAILLEGSTLGKPSVADVGDWLVLDFLLDG